MESARPKLLRLGDYTADHLLALLTSHSVPHAAFDVFPMRQATADLIPEELRGVAVRYQRMIREAIRRNHAKNDDR